MTLSEKQLRWIEEGLRLAVTAVLAAVQAAGNDEEMDWSKLRITETPEQALEKARGKRSQKTEVRSQKSDVGNQETRVGNG